MPGYFGARSGMRPVLGTAMNRGGAGAPPAPGADTGVRGGAGPGPVDPGQPSELALAQNQFDQMLADPYIRMLMQQRARQGMLNRMGWGRSAGAGSMRSTSTPGMLALLSMAGASSGGCGGGGCG